MTAPADTAVSLPLARLLGRVMACVAGCVATGALLSDWRSALVAGLVVLGSSVLVWRRFIGRRVQVQTSASVFVAATSIRMGLGVVIGLVVALAASGLDAMTVLLTLVAASVLALAAETWTVLEVLRPVVRAERHAIRTRAMA